MVPGCISHFMTPPDFKSKIIQACFSKKHDINISLEVSSRITFHVCLYINQYPLQFNFLSNLTTTTLEKRKIEMQRNLWSKILLTKEKKYAKTRSKEIIHHSRLTKQQNQRAKLKWFSICFSLTIWPIVQPSSHTFGSASYTGFLTEERRKEKGALFMKVMFVLIVHKKISASRKQPRQKDIQSQRKTTTSFTGKE